jgi:ABC-2 type transport system permease protein
VVDAFNAQWRADHGQSGFPLQVVNRAWYNPSLETRWFIVPALIGTLTMLQTLLLTALSVAREREEGTFDQLLRRFGLVGLPTQFVQQSSRAPVKSAG